MYSQAAVLLILYALVFYAGIGAHAVVSVFTEFRDFGPNGFAVADLVIGVAYFVGAFLFIFGGRMMLDLYAREVRYGVSILFAAVTVLNAVTLFYIQSHVADFVAEGFDPASLSGWLIADSLFIAFVYGIVMRLISEASGYARGMSIAPLGWFVVVTYVVVILFLLLRIAIS